MARAILSKAQPSGEVFVIVEGVGLCGPLHHSEWQHRDTETGEYAHYARDDWYESSDWITDSRYSSFDDETTAEFTRSTEWIDLSTSWGYVEA